MLNTLTHTHICTQTRLHAVCFEFHRILYSAHSTAAAAPLSLSFSTSLPHPLFMLVALLTLSYDIYTHILEHM